MADHDTSQDDGQFDGFNCELEVESRCLKLVVSVSDSASVSCWGRSSHWKGVDLDKVCCGRNGTGLSNLTEASDFCISESARNVL